MSDLKEKSYFHLKATKSTFLFHELVAAAWRCFLIIIINLVKTSSERLRNSWLALFKHPRFLTDLFVPLSELGALGFTCYCKKCQ